MPTPIGHSLWSASMYIILRKRFKDIRELKKDFFTIALCLIIGMFPDMDFIFLFFVRNAYLHRSFTHSFIFIVAAALLGGWILKSRKTINRPFLLSFLLVAGHLFWDYGTRCNRVPYGTMLFWPFSARYVSTPRFLQIFPGFDWTNLEGLLSINLLMQIAVELAIFMPLLIAAFFLKKNYCHENRFNKA